MVACFLGSCLWGLTAHADPVDLPAAGLPPDQVLSPALDGMDPAVTIVNLEGSLATVPPLPVPRFELEDPLARPPLHGELGYVPPTRDALHASWLPSEGDPRGEPLDPQTGLARGSAWTPGSPWEPSGPYITPLSPLDSNQPAPARLTSTSASAPPPQTFDDRSGWARWNASLWGVSTTVLAFDAVMVAAFTLLPTEVTGWHEPEFNGLKKNFTEGPRVDNDRFLFNYVAHPLAGSEYYLIARNRDLNWWQSMAYSAALSSAFEFLIESAYEQASWQDIWITPVSGTVIGELRWQVKKALENPSTGKPVGIFDKILYVVIDPFDAVYKL